jgi:fructoselysine-6-P-deglycase FrlB-like protein
MDHPDLPNLIKRMKAITAAVRLRIEEIEAKDSPLARKTDHHADLQAIKEEGYRIRKAMTALFRTQEHLLRTDGNRWATERTRLNDEIQERFAAFDRAVAEYRRQLGLLPFRR